eukprot:5469083-Amphidinium_carterae.2
MAQHLAVGIFRQLSRPQHRVGGTLPHLVLGKCCRTVPCIGLGVFCRNVHECLVSLDRHLGHWWIVQNVRGELVPLTVPEVIRTVAGLEVGPGTFFTLLSLYPKGGHSVAKA